MIEVKPLESITQKDFRRIVTGYVSPIKFIVDWEDGETGSLIRLRPIQLEIPYVKIFEFFPDELVISKKAVKMGFSYGAFDGKALVGLGIAEPRWWNKSLWIWEFHIAEGYRGMGIGHRMMEALAERAKNAGLRTMICETQNTNGPAIHFYRKTGFQMEGVDISYYTNQDYPDGEIALFMKKRI